MNALAHLPSAMQVPSLAGQSLEDAILETEPNEPEGTVRTRIRRAKQLLEGELGRLSADPRLLESTLSNLEDWARSVRGGAAGQ